MQEIDVAVLGGGPAGLQAALVLSRAQRRVVVFDAPAPARNAASHGVHNFLGLDGLLPAEIRARAWQQIEVYGQAEKMDRAVESVIRSGDGFEVRAGDLAVRARRVVAAFGYADRRPRLDGFEACWGRTIIPCPFCDGYEHSDRVWGVVVESPHQLAVFPRLSLHWASRAELFVAPGLELGKEEETALRALGLVLHRASVAALHHAGGELRGVTLSNGTEVRLETLFWQPPSEPVPLLRALVEGLGLALDENGWVVHGEGQQTNVPGLYVAGDLGGWAGAIRAAAEGGEAAIHMIKNWG